MIKKRSKISLITLSKSQGGANIAASRISNILNKSFNVETFYPEKKNLFGLFKYYFARLIIKIFIGKTKYLNSLNLFSRIEFSKIKGEIFFLNWINEEVLSLDDLIKIKKPILWTMHDMWPVTSTEHFLENPTLKKYTKKNVQDNFIKKKIYKKKRIFFDKKNVNIITNSKWLESFCKKSDLTKNVRIQKIYNPIKTKMWNRKNKNISKKKLNLNVEKKYILFGAHGGLKNFRKGGDLLIESLKELKNIENKVEFIVLGVHHNYTETISKFNFHFRKFTLNTSTQVFYHSASEMTVIPSRGESIPQFGVETILCGNPVVSFNIGGLKEIINHKSNGYLAKPFNVKDFSKGVEFCLNKIKKKQLNKSRLKIKNMFDENNVLLEYKKIINDLLLNHK